ncbi:splicing factor, suppressor of white-apricot homolog isoform X1 [Mizuhopecten yessoensis]|uniref:splicing factor, suppressor of white-apricot homolog isoform X1 n=1 Tax=Mizuhopecten yessoensis TaxID=6573 RepID=UPI000B45DB9D|nr:splicing factor, suppressor of white-apricot homolog isoform X1 [Mizuhopecten yessoensis]
MAAAQWWAQANEEENRQSKAQEELFVFGYACKVFRDDEKASFVDQEKHLIPWMSDDRVLIDRYDGRGHLFDLSAYDASNIKDTEQTLTEDEEQIEKLCDEERFLELRTDLAEKTMYEEEEWKRYYLSLSEGYNAVGFSYDYAQQMAAEQQPEVKIEAVEDKPFVVAPELHVPPEINVPELEKQNAIIEKTAKFIAEHGAQMEIIIKTKQSNNAQFEFMHFENTLNPYYKHMVKMIKSGKYRPKAEEIQEDLDSSYEEEHPDGYLHPSLMIQRASPTPDLKPIKMPTGSIHDTPYGQLIKSLKRSNKQHDKASNDSGADRQPHTEASAIQPPPLPPYMSLPEYGTSNSSLPLPPGLEPVTLPSAHQPPPPPPGTDVDGNIYLSQDSPASEDSSSRDSFSIPGAPQIVPPPPDLQPVIDRMAMYVAKNGVEFEIVVKSKNDPRFAFLESYHVHFPYYNFKKNIHITETAKEKRRLEKERPKGVSFSIKGKPREQESASLEKRQVFDNDSSDEEGDRDKLYKSDLSGTSTPVDADFMLMENTRPDTSRSDTSRSDYSRAEQPRAEYSRAENKVDRAELIEKLERKQAEERLKDRMAAAAREKLVQANKEKQMQAERKRKAAMFINMLKSTNVTTSTTSAADDQRDMEESGSTGTPIGSRSQTPITQEEDRLSDYSDRSSKSSKKSRERGSSPPSRSRKSPSPPSRSKSPRRKRSPIPLSAYVKSRRSSSKSPHRRPILRTQSPPRKDRSKSPRYRVNPSLSPGRSKSVKRSRSPSPSKSSSKSSRRSPTHSVRKSKKKKRSRSRSPRHKSSSSKRVGDVIGPVQICDLTIKQEPGLLQSATDITDNIDKAKTYSYTDFSNLPPLPDCLPPEPPSDSRAPLPPLPPLPPDSDSNSCSLPGDSKGEEKTVSNYMLNRVRAIIKASRQAILQEEGFDDP